MLKCLQAAPSCSPSLSRPGAIALRKVGRLGVLHQLNLPSRLRCTCLPFPGVTARPIHRNFTLRRSSRHSARQPRRVREFGGFRGLFQSQTIREPQNWFGAWETHETPTLTGATAHDRKGSTASSFATFQWKGDRR
jgi:hypothetical protein